MTENANRLTSDKMAKAIEMTSVHNLVKDSETALFRDNVRKFEYKLDDKTAKGKFMKGAKRTPFEVVENSSSANLIFNLGSWYNLVLPSNQYWEASKGNKTLNIDGRVVKIADVKTGKDISGKHIDTQIVFFSNRDKMYFIAITQRN